MTSLKTATFVAALLVASPLSAGAPPLHEQIDRLLRATDPEFESLVAPPADDVEFFRRAYLDLWGVIPSAAAAREFLADDGADKRTELIDRLMAHPRHARRLEAVFDVMLMEREGSGTIPAKQWREYLRNSFAENKPWSTLARELLAADGADAEKRAAAKFYLDRDFQMDRVTRDVGRIFLGVDLECAQCHDHPAIGDYLQRHYYGIGAFLKRSYVFTDSKKKKMLGEKAEGDVTFTSVFTQEESSTDPRLLDLPAVPDPEGMEKQYEVEPSKKARGVPKYSRRKQLAAAMASSENVQFRRNIVNRLWALMMGRGLVEPLDLHHADNPPSHPELLDMLADEFASHGDDVRWFLRELALTEAYQRSSVARYEPQEASRLYAVALLKPLSPEQLAWSAMQATGQLDVTLQKLQAKLRKEDPDKGEQRQNDPAWQTAALAEAVDGHVEQFSKRFAVQGGQKTGFDATAEQALFLINGPLVAGWLEPQPGNLTERLGQLDTDEAVAEELFLSVLSRPPSDAEMEDVTNYLAEGDDRKAALPELVWALLSSAEFRFNH